VKRSELYDDSSDREKNPDDAEEDAAARASLNAKLADLLGLDFSVEPKAASDARRRHDAISPMDVDNHVPEPTEEENKPHHDEEFEFRLFSTTSAAKVILPDDDESAAAGREAGLVVPSRPLSYYMAGEPSPELRERYRLSAITTEDILKAAQKRSWGLEMPWRVTKITVSAKKLPASTSQYAIGEANFPVKRKRPGKKRRIALRKKGRTQKEKEEAKKRQELEKEEHLREKKKRLNREKKLKRRQKEKEKKLVANEGGADGVQEDGVEPASSSSDEGSR
jgi:hypothetical protein